MLPQPTTVWSHVLPEGEPEGDFLDFYATASTYAMPLAFALSYARHRDLRWAAIHAFFGLPYLAYLAANALDPRDVS